MSNTYWEKLLSPGLWWDSLPGRPSDDDPETRDYFVIAGGLTLLLSRLPPDVAERTYPAAWELKSLLRSSRRRRCGGISRALINDACHEIAEIADRPTKDAMLRRLRGRGST
jgi:hypothetical protein